MNYSQSKCFFFGPISSSVVALQTDFASPCPAKLCFAAKRRSLIVCPAIDILNWFLLCLSAPCNFKTNKTFNESQLDTLEILLTFTQTFLWMIFSLIMIHRRTFLWELFFRNIFFLPRHLPQLHGIFFTCKFVEFLCEFYLTHSTGQSIILEGQSRPQSIRNEMNARNLI